jgi:hypothetical protein
MKRILYLIVLAIAMSNTPTSIAQNGPEFLPDEDPHPKGQQWIMVEEMSDEFDGNELDTVKWMNTDPNRWIGRAPGVFKRDTVSLGDSQLRITNYLLDKPEWHNNQLYTHAGGHVISRVPGQVGYYFEARMKASKTFMSSTFWVINYRNEQTGCDVRVTELDIQECVGEVTTNAGWAQNFDESMHSNTHSRNVTCDTPVGSRGGSVSTGGKVYEDFHVYGAWWKSPSEVMFFLDGQHVYTVNPVADFDIEMYMKLVTETYDWNPVPAGGGMNGNESERTTSYDWVRTWQLVDAGGHLTPMPYSINTADDLVDSISFNPATVLPPQSSYTVSVEYTASESRDIVLEFWRGNQWLDNGRATVKAGQGTIDLSVDLGNPPPPGDNYLWKASIRPVGSGWQENLDLVEQGNITVLPN